MTDALSTRLSIQAKIVRKNDESHTVKPKLISIYLSKNYKKKPPWPSNKARGLGRIKNAVTWPDLTQTRAPLGFQKPWNSTSFAIGEGRKLEEY